MADEDEMGGDQRDRRSSGTTHGVANERGMTHKQGYTERDRNLGSIPGPLLSGTDDD